MWGVHVVVLHSRSHLLVRLIQGLAMMGLSTCLSTSLKARGAEWLHALLNKDLGLCFTVC